MQQQIKNNLSSISFDQLETEYAQQGKVVAKGRVASLDGNEALIVTERNSGCAGCGSQSGCGTATLSKLFSPRNARPLKVANTLGAKVGDEVLLSIMESHLFKHSLMAYGLPLIGLIVLAWLGLAVTGSDGVSILGGLLGLLGGWWLTARLYRPALPVLEKIFDSSTMDV